MDTYKSLLLANKAWVQEKLKLDRDFFTELSKDQRPEFLWIGCSDSRVPAEEVTGTSPGEIFVHRNIANLVVNTDLNMLSVLHYAIEVLKVSHIIVCGHYGCGGVRAAMSNQRFGVMDQWLRQIKDVYHYHKDEIQGCGDVESQTNRLVELSVLEQLRNITKTTGLQGAWHHERRPTLHGWVFNMGDGLLKSLYRLEPGTPIEDIYRYDPRTLA